MISKHRELLTLEVLVGRWDGYFDRLRRGEVVLPTAGRAACRPAGVLPLAPDLRKTG